MHLLRRPVPPIETTHTAGMLLATATLLLLTTAFGHLQAQPLPTRYFANPLRLDIGLSATFAEFRTGHFHAGLDMRTAGAIGQPVCAAADGYVARVSISAWGGGKILYIKHPNGYTSVYMHLDSYAGAIGEAVRKEQYAQQSFSISKTFLPGQLPVKKGQVVARSGNSGGSGGPHLHFEIRRGGADDLHTHATTINPLLFGLPYRDGIAPVIRGLRVYPTHGNPTELGKGNSISVSGPFYLGIYATDAAEGSTLKNGPDKVEVFLDGTLFFRYTTEAFPLDSSRKVNALVDYRHFVRTRQPYLLTRALPGAEGPWVPVRLGDGIFRLKPGSTHSIGIRVSDIAGNTAERVLTVTAASSGRPAPTVEPTAPQGAALTKADYTKPLSIRHSDYRIATQALTLYADDYLLTTARDSGAFLSSVVQVGPILHDIPPDKAFDLSLRCQPRKGIPAGKVVVVRIDGRRLTAYKTSAAADGWHTASVRDFGRYALAADTTPPKATPANFSEGKPLRSHTLKVRISDDLAGIEHFACRLNGRWILADHDGKTATLTIDTGKKLHRGRNTLEVEVADGAGNRSVKRWELTASL